MVLWGHVLDTGVEEDVLGLTIKSLFIYHSRSSYSIHADFG